MGVVEVMVMLVVVVVVVVFLCGHVAVGAVAWPGGGCGVWGLSCAARGGDGVR